MTEADKETTDIGTLAELESRQANADIGADQDKGTTSRYRPREKARTEADVGTDIHGDRR